MEHTGYIRIERKKIPFYLKDKKVHLIPDNPFASLMPGNIKEKEIVKGTTTDNREIIFIGCRYNSCILIYKALIISDYNTGIYPEITKFDRICFEGRAVNTFAGPGRAFTSEKGSDTSNQMKTIIPKKWEDINFTGEAKLKRDKIKLAIIFTIRHNLKYDKTSMGEAIPNFSLEYEKGKNIKYIPQIYLMAYYFFCFLNFRRNIIFNKITLQIKKDDIFYPIATVYVNSNINDDFDRNENNSIISTDCIKFWNKLFSVIALRRTQKIYDNFYIPLNSKEAPTVTYEKYLACALSFESEYTRLYPTKKEDNKSYAEIHNIFVKTADELNVIFHAIQNDQITFNDFFQIYIDGVNKEYTKLVKNSSKTKKRKTDGYFNKIKDSLSKIDYSLADKYKNALNDNIEYLQPVIDQLCKHNNITFPSAYEAGTIFADFRNKIAHGNPEEIKSIHCVLYEIARAMIYIMILKMSDADNKSIKTIISKLF